MQCGLPDVSTTASEKRLSDDLLCPVTVTVCKPLTMMEHGIWGNPNPSSWATVTHMCLLEEEEKSMEVRGVSGGGGSRNKWLLVTVLNK